MATGEEGPVHLLQTQGGGPIRAQWGMMREGMRTRRPSVADQVAHGFGCMWVGVGGYRRVLETPTAPQLPPSPSQDADAVKRTSSTTSYFTNPCVA